jgi:glycosyltransferase involved in cell wall biosynthesis
MSKPLVTVAIPSFNQAEFLEQALQSVFEQDLPLEVIVLDGGSTDGSLDIIQRWQHRLDGWRSEPDAGQAAAINEGVARGTAPYVCWLNSDDFFYPRGLARLIETLCCDLRFPFTYGNCWTVSANGNRRSPYITLPFSSRMLANYCFIAQPATLVRRSAWAAIGGVREELDLAFDYDLWWRLYLRFGRPAQSDAFVAATRRHPATKTATRTDQHYDESMALVQEHWGSVPAKWHLTRPLLKGLRKVGF